MTDSSTGAGTAHRAAAGAVGHGGQSRAQRQGAPCWQPQPQVDAAAAGVWQPQVQAAPTQELQVQGEVSVFMIGSLGWAQAGSSLREEVWALCAAGS
jgi:hypothetical protein